jgi:hypothetical protein
VVVLMAAAAASTAASAEAAAAPIISSSVTIPSENKLQPMEGEAGCNSAPAFAPSYITGWVGCSLPAAVDEECSSSCAVGYKGRASASCIGRGLWAVFVKCIRYTSLPPWSDDDTSERQGSRALSAVDAGKHDLQLAVQHLTICVLGILMGSLAGQDMSQGWLGWCIHSSAS